MTGKYDQNSFSVVDHSILGQPPRQYKRKKLCPIIEINVHSFVLLTHQLTSVPKSVLEKETASLENDRHEILGAIDMLLTGI